jgi:hypothetical protein
LANGIGGHGWEKQVEPDQDAPLSSDGMAGKAVNYLRDFGIQLSEGFTAFLQNLVPGDIGIQIIMNPNMGIFSEQKEGRNEQQDESCSQKEKIPLTPLFPAHPESLAKQFWEAQVNMPFLRRTIPGQRGLTPDGFRKAVQE